MKDSSPILILGSGDVASAAAHRLFSAGLQVALHEGPAPSATRRQMAFTDAVFDGQAWLEGVQAVRVDDLSALPVLLAAHRQIPLVVSDLEALIAALQPRILVDARLRKHSLPPDLRSLAPLAIGVGPGFAVGLNAHVVIETAYGENLGRVLWQGAAQPLAGEPKEIDGHARDRYVYAPQAGIFETSARLGDPVSAGQAVARLGEVTLSAPIDGVLRGLTHTGVFVPEHTKVIEVDPRRDAPQVAGIGERPGKIAEGVLQAVFAIP